MLIFSQLPDFFGGSCTCAGEGGCLRSNKGPWNDPDIMKVCFPLYHICIFVTPILEWNLVAIFQAESFCQSQTSIW